MRFRLRTLLIVLGLGPAVLAVLVWAWMRGGLSDALDVAYIVFFLVSSLAAINYAIKQNLGY